MLVLLVLEVTASLAASLGLLVPSMGEEYCLDSELGPGPVPWRR